MSHQPEAQPEALSQHSESMSQQPENTSGNSPLQIKPTLTEVKSQDIFGSSPQDGTIEVLSDDENYDFILFEMEKSEEAEDEKIFEEDSQKEPQKKPQQDLQKGREKPDELDDPKKPNTESQDKLPEPQQEEPEKSETESKEKGPEDQHEKSPEETKNEINEADVENVQKHKVVNYIPELTYLKEREKIRNRNITESINRVAQRNLPAAKILNEKYLHVGKLVIRKENLKNQNGNGSGVLISKNYFLTAKHCYLSTSGNKLAGPLEETFVIFGAWGDFYSKGTEYKVLRSIETEEAKKYGLLGQGDFILLELEGDPGLTFGWTELVPIETPPKELYLLQYGAGAHLKMSQDDKVQFLPGEIKVSHKIAPKMSGGPFFTEEGKIFAIHIGQDPSTGEGSASLPWSEDSKNIEGLILHSGNAQVSGTVEVNSQSVGYDAYEQKHYGTRRIRVCFFYDSFHYDVTYKFITQVHSSSYNNNAANFYLEAGARICQRTIQKVPTVGLIINVIAYETNHQIKCEHFSINSAVNHKESKKETKQETTMKKMDKKSNKYS